MQKWIKLIAAAGFAASLSLLSGCGTMHAWNNLEEGHAATFGDMWDRWVASEGDIAYATTWEIKVEDGVSVEDVVDAINAVAINRNIKAVGDLPLSEELKARGIKSGYLRVLSFCSPTIARHMVDFSPHMAAYLPCRVTIVEKEDGLWIYTLNMDMMVKGGRKLPPELKKEAMRVRDTIWEMLQKGAAGEF